MRIFSLFPACAVLLSSCGGNGGDPGNGSAQAGEPIACAIAGSTDYSSQCRVVRSLRADGAVELTIFHPNGGFRRLIVTSDGSGVVAADGAEAARVRVIGDKQIDVALGDSHYRLPATMKAVARPPQ